MKLSATEITKLENIINAARASGIDKLIIEPNKARGIDEKKTVVIISDQEIPDLGGKTLGLNRLGLLQDRLSLVRNGDGFSVELVCEKDGTDITQLNLAGGKTKTSFKCASQEFIRGIPKGVNDNWKYAFDVSLAAITYLSSAVNAMGAEILTITGKSDGVNVELQDVNKDTFVSQLSESVASVDSTAVSSFVFNYPVKTLMPLLKKAGGESISVIIGEKGILQLFLNGHSIMVLPSL